MEKTLVTSGKTIDLAVEAALTQLGLDRDSVSVMVLQQAKSGFLGLGAQLAKVQVTYEAPDPIPEAPKVALSSASRSKPKAAAKPAPEKKPEPKAADTWDCPECGNKGITAKFCGECGCKRPEAPAAWDCPECGNKGITGKFCGECGCKKPEAPATWNCPECGNKDISAKFCPECGHKKP